LKTQAYSSFEKVPFFVSDTLIPIKWFIGYKYPILSEKGTYASTPVRDCGRKAPLRQPDCPNEN